MTTTSSVEPISEIFLLERYKYILEQKKELNKTTFRVAAIYQTATLAIYAAQFAVLKDRLAGTITSDIAIAASKILSMLLLFVSVFASVLIVSGVLSWIKYRKDENEISQISLGVSRASPNLKDALRWYETYLLSAIAAMFVANIVILYSYVLPFLMS